MRSGSVQLRKAENIRVQISIHAIKSTLLAPQVAISLLVFSEFLSFHPWIPTLNSFFSASRPGLAAMATGFGNRGRFPNVHNCNPYGSTKAASERGAESNA
jgi:hypothetical protein